MSDKVSSEYEWSEDEEKEIARLMKEFKLNRIKAIQKMQRTKTEKANRLRLFGSKNELQTVRPSK